MKYVIINEGTISIKRIMCNILIVYFTRKQWGNTDNLFISMALYGYTVIARGAKQGGGLGGLNPP